MANAEISNKNIFLNLNEGEEIVYVAEKSKFEFYCFVPFIVFVVIPLSSFFVFMSIAIPLKGSCLILLLWITLFYMSYIFIRDYFFSNLILTNQRLILYRFNNPIFIDNRIIKNISRSISVNGPIPTIISLKSNKTYRIYFVDDSKLKAKFEEICSNYNDEIKEQNSGILLIGLAILMIGWMICTAVNVFWQIKH